MTNRSNESHEQWLKWASRESKKLSFRLEKNSDLSVFRLTERYSKGAPVFIGSANEIDAFLKGFIAAKKLYSPYE